MRRIFVAFLLMIPVPAMAAQNLIENVRNYGNTTITDGVIQQVTPDPQQEWWWKFQLMYNNGKHLPWGADGTTSYLLMFNSTNRNVGFLSRTFTTPDDVEDVSFVRFGTNGSQRDTTIMFDVKDIQPNTTYTMQWRLLNSTQGEIAWTDMFLAHCGDGYSLKLGETNCSRECENQVVAHGHIPPDTAHVYEPDTCTYNPAHTVCDNGYYLNNDECTTCGMGYYCNNNTRYQCPPNNTNFTEYYGGTVLQVDPPYTLASGSTTTASQIGHCVGQLLLQTPMGKYKAECRWNGVNYYDQCNGKFDLWYEASTGYYLRDYNFTSSVKWYHGVAECTNAPEHAHYTGVGTPDAPDGSIKDANDCPWECDAGYAAHDGNCVQLCTAGITQIRIGNITVPLYSEPQTNPAIHIKYSNYICYGCLTPGTAADAINIKFGDTSYHTVK